MNQYRFCTVNKFQVHNLWTKDRNLTLVISWYQVFLDSGPVSAGSLLVQLAIVLLAV